MLIISNHKMRLLWLKTNALQNTKNEKLEVLQIIKNLGFVQLDSIQNVTRAHHHILWSRNQGYKEHMIDDLLLEKGNIFEHFTHDASVLPVEFYPYWRGHFIKMKEKIDKSKYYKDILNTQDTKNMIDRMKNEGALHSIDFEMNTNDKIKLDKKIWTRSTHKNTLDYLWYTGILTTAYRNSFRKYYDLMENIIPKDILKKEISRNEQIDWLCNQALHRLSVATVKEIKNFWDTLTIVEVKNWIKENKAKVRNVQWENNEGRFIDAFAPLDIEKRLENLKDSNTRIKIINPFDPAIRNRTRLKAIFDFEYKIEIFVPKGKRIWGYYVYPLLLGNTFIGRIELQANRKEGQLTVLNFWLEDEIILDDSLETKLSIELDSFASFVGITNIHWLKPLS